MGTNFYIQRKEPEVFEVKDYHAQHIAKTSWGWLPLFEESDKEYEISSVRDIENLMRTGDFVITDEYDVLYTWEEFKERVLDWGVDKEEAISHIEYAEGDRYDSPDRYRKDESGYEFYKGDFF